MITCSDRFVDIFDAARMNAKLGAPAIALNERTFPLRPLPTNWNSGAEAVADIERTWRSLPLTHLGTYDDTAYFTELDPIPHWASAFSHHHERPCREIPREP